MVSTALDFREMMRKEREAAMKKLAMETAAPAARWVSTRRIQSVTFPLHLHMLLYRTRARAGRVDHEIFRTGAVQQPSAI